MGEQHVLIINSLRDLDVTCSCGLWALFYTTTDADSDDYLHRHAKNMHARHVTSVVAASSLAVQKRFAEDWKMPLEQVQHLVKLANAAGRYNELSSNGEAHPLGGPGNRASNSLQWGNDVDRTTKRIEALVKPYGFTEVVYNGLWPTLKKGEQFVEVPY